MYTMYNIIVGLLVALGILLLLNKSHVINVKMEDVLDWSMGDREQWLDSFFIKKFIFDFFYESKIKEDYS